MCNARAVFMMPILENCTLRINWYNEKKNTHTQTHTHTSAKPCTQIYGDSVAFGNTEMWRMQCGKWSQVSKPKMVGADGSCGCEMKSGVCFYNPDFIVVSDALGRSTARSFASNNGIKTNVKILWQCDSDSGIASISIKATCSNFLYFLGVFSLSLSLSFHPTNLSTVHFGLSLNSIQNIFQVVSVFLRFFF